MVLLSVDRHLFRHLCPYPVQSPPRPIGLSFNLPKGRLQRIMFVAVCFFVGRAVLLDGLLTFAPALATALLYTFCPGTAAGIAAALAGLISSLGANRALPYLVVILFLALIRSFRKSAWPAWAPPVLLALSTVAIRGLTVWSRQASWYDLGLILFEAALAAVASAIFSQALPAMLGQEVDAVFSNEELISFGLIIAVGLMGTAGLPGGPVAPIRVLGRYIGVLIACAGGGMVGSAAGVLVATVSTIAGAATGGEIGVFGFAGLLAGLMCEAGKPGAAVGYGLGELILAMYLVPHYSSYQQLLSLGAALLLFALTPKKWIAEVAGLIPGTRQQQHQQKDYESRLSQAAGDRLTELGQVLRELARSFEEVAAAVVTEDDIRADQLLGQLTKTLCEQCDSYRSCWERDFAQTYQYIFELLSLAELNDGQLTADMPRVAEGRCSRIPELLAAVAHLYEMERLNAGWRQRLGDEREIVAGQLAGMAQVMENLAADLKIEVQNLGVVGAAVEENLSCRELKAKSVEAWRAADGRMEVLITELACPGYRQCLPLIESAVSEAIGQPVKASLKGCPHRDVREQCLVKAVPAPVYRFIAGGFTCSRTAGDVSGDSFSALELPDGRQALILSDGMGFGIEAATESQTAVRLVERLLAAGLNQQVILQTLNTVLALRSEEERFATLDLALLNTYTAEAEFIKVGSCPSFLLRGQTVSVIRPGAPPLGILPTLSATVSKKKLRNGDVLVMISDGVLEARRERTLGVDWLLNYLKLSREDPEQLARSILDLAQRRSDGSRDDMTVLAVKVMTA